MARRPSDALGRIGRRLRTMPQEGVAEATKILRAEIRRNVKRDTGGDNLLSGLRNGSALSVKVTQRGTELVEGRVMAGPKDQRAPWFWLEEGTRPGLRGAPVGRYNSARVSRGYHPGTPAFRTWSRSFDAVEAKIRQDMERRWQRAIEEES
jgi:hypothetical protein